MVPNDMLGVTVRTKRSDVWFYFGSRLFFFYYYSTDQQVAVMRLDMLQSINEDGKEVVRQQKT